ncbi:MAG: hypothetical protein ACE37H_14505 [Phycisphaeraceae bacterium]
MQTHGYERGAAWKQSLAMLDQTRALTDAFESDPFGLAGKLRSLALELPVFAATIYEQFDYDSATSFSNRATQHLFQLWLQAQLAEHLGLLTKRQLGDLRKKIDTLDAMFAELPDALFEDDGEDEPAQAA